MITMIANLGMIILSDICHITHYGVIRTQNFHYTEYNKKGTTIQQESTTRNVYSFEIGEFDQLRWQSMQLLPLNKCKASNKKCTI